MQLLRLATTVFGVLLLGLAAEAADLVVAPESDLDAAGYPWGPFVPASVAYTVSNATAAPLVWTAQSSASWLSLWPTQGELEGLSAATVTVWFNHSALYLPPGQHFATVQFAHLSQPGELVSRSATLDIHLPPPPTLESVARCSSRLQISVACAPGTTVVLESSDDLRTWRAERTNYFESALGAFEFPIAEEANRFFRAASLGPEAQPASLALSNRFTCEDDLALVRVRGQPAGIYQLEASLDGDTWAAVATQKLCHTATYIFTNTSAQASETVYRARAVAPSPLATVRQVLIVGQSLALGIEGAPALTVTASDRHFRFYTEGSADYLHPLYEAGSETIASSAAHQAGFTAPDLRLVFSNVGVGGASYAQLKKGTDNYALGLQQLQRAPGALACRLFRVVPAAIFCVHGEGDWTNPHYADDVRQWQADYESDWRRLSGLPVRVPMFHTQISAWTAGGGAPHALSPFQVLAAAEADPERTVLVGPKYFLPYALPLGIHLNNEGYRWLGEYYGKVFKRVVLDGETWSPLRPVRITLEGRVITARFHVPVPPLVLDTWMVSNPGNYGFEYHDESEAPPSIASVELLPDEDAVRITLTAEPAPGSQPRLRYAYTGIPGQPGGPTTGPRGNLRDSDPEPSLTENPLYNWCVHFDKPVPY